MSGALARIPVGVVVQRRKADSPWIDFTWRPVAVLPGQPATTPWSLLSDDGETATFYAGASEIALYRTETANYRDNLAAESALWVVLRPTESEPPYDVITVTADPAEGEAFTEPGVDLVDCVPMPDSVREAVAAFVAEYHVENESFHKRERQRANPEALARRSRIEDGGGVHE